MKDGEHMPYSPEGLKALASTLKIHKSLLWFDATNSRIAFAQLPSREYQQSYEEEEE